MSGMTGHTSQKSSKTHGTSNGIEHDFQSLRSSDYNYFIEDTDGSMLGYNFLYGSTIRIPAKAFSAVNGFLEDLDLSDEDPLRRKSLDAVPEHWVKALISTGFVIDDEVDELDIIKFSYLRNLFANDALRLVILPTLSCNFNCPYCFQSQKSRTMSRETEEILKNWVEKNFSHKRQIHVGWFGGEPLLAIDFMSRMSEWFMGFAESIGAKYSSGITTNGYFLQPDIIDKLSSLGIEHVQITLDGDKHDHDALRSLKNGEGTFDQLVKNIVTFVERVPESGCRLGIRVNCCDDNYHGIGQMLERFPKVVRERVKIYFRWVYSNKASGYKEFSSEARGFNPFKGLHALYEQARKVGWQTREPEYERQDAYCEVDYIDQYTIGPDGKIFFCTHAFDEADAIGSLADDFGELSPKTASTIAKWYMSSPFGHQRCISCKLLPVCMGGCRKARYQGRHSCFQGSESADLFVRNMLVEMGVMQSATMPSKREG